MNRAYILAALLISSIIAAAQNGSDKPAVTKEGLIKKWQNIFSPKVDFSNDLLFQPMVYIGPQQDAELSNFGNKKLGTGLVTQRNYWLNRFFNDPIIPLTDSFIPQKYYLSKKGEASVLYYKWKYRRYSLTMYESYNGLLLRIKNDSMTGFPRISGKQLSGVLMSIFNIKNSSRDSIFKAFKLPVILTAGNVFSNSGNKIQFIRKWQDHIVGFVTEDDICILIFKSSELRAEAGFTFDGYWLNNGLFESDGKTPVTNKANEN
jgi:hypothetical protein